MTDNDPQARERLRTILTDRIEYADAANGHQTTADTLAPELLTEFGAMCFERKVNEHEVPVRRVVAATGWEVDPERKTALSLGEQVHDADRCKLGGQPHTGPCADPVRWLSWTEVEAFIKRMRDRHDISATGTTRAYEVLDDLLDDFREHMHTGTPLDAEVQSPHNEGH